MPVQRQAGVRSGEGVGASRDMKTPCQVHAGHRLPHIHTWSGKGGEPVASGAGAGDCRRAGLPGPQSCEGSDSAKCPQLCAFSWEAVPCPHRSPRACGLHSRLLVGQSLFPLTPLPAPYQWLSECGPGTSSISVYGELLKNANSEALLGPNGSDALGGAQQVG